MELVRVTEPAALFVGCSQNSVACTNGTPIEEYP
jgi:hypothetical protein